MELINAAVLSIKKLALLVKKKNADKSLEAKLEDTGRKVDIFCDSRPIDAICLIGDVLDRHVEKISSPDDKLLTPEEIDAEMKLVTDSTVRDVAGLLIEPMKTVWTKCSAQEKTEVKDLLTKILISYYDTHLYKTKAKSKTKAKVSK